MPVFPEPALCFNEQEGLRSLSQWRQSLEVALEILKRRHQDLAGMCSHVYPLAEADKAVRALGREIDDGHEVVHVNLNMTGA